jgi:hypothetical protein
MREEGERRRTCVTITSLGVPRKMEITELPLPRPEMEKQPVDVMTPYALIPAARKHVLFCP